MRLLLDENISSRIAEQLRAEGHDVVAVTEVPDLRGQPDGAVFEWAVDRDRAIVTYDARFAALLQERLATGSTLTDLILVPERRFPSGDRGHGALLRALGALLDAAPPKAARGRLIWL